MGGLIAKGSLSQTSFGLTHLVTNPLNIVNPSHLGIYYNLENPDQSTHSLHN